MIHISLPAQLGLLELNYNAVYHLFTIVFIVLQCVGVLRAEKMSDENGVN